MKEGSELMAHFAAEKQAGALAAAIGLLAAGFSYLLWRTGTPWRAMVLPLVMIGLLEIGLGAGLLWRTDAQVERLQRGLAERRAESRAAEPSRIGRVHGKFRILLAVEVALLAAGPSAALLLRPRPAWAAAGMGLLLKASVLLVFDLFAGRRALADTAWLEGLGRGG